MKKIIKKIALILAITIMTLNLSSCTKKEEPKESVEVSPTIDSDNLVVKVQNISETLLNPIQLNIRKWM